MERDEVLDIFNKRVSVRKYLDKEVELEDVKTVLEAGRSGPTGINEQQLVFIALTSKDKIEKYTKAISQYMKNENADYYYGAPAIILVLSKKERLAVQNGSAAIENMLLAASMLGLGACWIHQSSLFLNTEPGKKMLEEFGIEGDYYALESVALGYIDGELPQPKERKQPYYII